MSVQTITVSDRFRSQAKRAILSIVLFVIVFLVLIALALGLTVVCVFGAIALIAAIPNLWIIVLGLGLASVGFLVLYFLLKFLFAKHTTDRSEFIKVDRRREPRLFAMIDEIVAAVGTTFPKHVYLSQDVNAAVFFDSNFWSMFFPIKKNLIIGLGLVNTVSEAELKAVLAHEFGHFSQRSMKVGSYVYNTNQIIHNMLHDNDGFGRVVTGWGNVHGLIGIFVMVAVRIIQVIQWILGHLYNFINLSYMSLSREMEFHADEVAAHVSGSEPMSKALLRIDLAQHALGTVINFYSRKVKDNFGTENLYPEQLHALHFLSHENDLPVSDGFPQISVDDLDKFNHSKLVIDNQWASHPDTADRVAALRSLNIVVPKQVGTPANQLFEHLADYQERFSRQFFKDVTYSGEPTMLSLAEFKASFREDHDEHTFAALYRGYYDQYNPQVFALDLSSSPATEIDELFSEASLDRMYNYLGLEKDLASLNIIAAGQTTIKTFDYNGIKYRVADSRKLVTRLTTELETVRTELAEHDRYIYHAFHQIATPQQGEQLTARYAAYFAFEETYATNIDLHQQITQRLQFVSEITPPEQIVQNFKEVAVFEKTLKEKISVLLNNTFYTPILHEVIRKRLEKYLAHVHVYFLADAYVEDNLQLLFNTLASYELLLNNAHFLHRKQLLDFQVEIYGS